MVHEVISPSNSYPADTCEVTSSEKTAESWVVWLQFLCRRPKVLGQGLSECLMTSPGQMIAWREAKLGVAKIAHGDKPSAQDEGGWNRFRGCVFLGFMFRISWCAVEVGDYHRPRCVLQNSLGDIDNLGMRLDGDVNAPIPGEALAMVRIVSGKVSTQVGYLVRPREQLDQGLTRFPELIQNARFDPLRDGVRLE